MWKPTRTLSPQICLNALTFWLVYSISLARLGLLSGGCFVCAKAGQEFASKLNSLQGSSRSAMKMTCLRNVPFSHLAWFAPVGTDSVRAWQPLPVAMCWLAAAQKAAKSCLLKFCAPDLGSFISMALGGEKRTSRNSLSMMRNRAAFLAARNGVRAHANCLRIETVYTEPRGNSPRIGLTVTKKNGNSVVRNRIKRRMRAAIISVGTDEMRRDHNYVFISKPNALNAPFESLRSDIRALIEKSHKRLDEKSVKS